MSQTPQAFIRTRRDAMTILTLWCLRTTSLLLLLLGLTFLVIAREIGEDIATRLDTPGEWLRALTTPLAGVALAVAVRAVIAVLAWFTAAPLVISEVPPLVPTAGQSAWRQMTDRWRQISGTASVRGTWAVRSAAIVEAGVWGPRLRYTDIVLRVLCVVAGVALVIAMVLAS